MYSVMYANIFLKMYSVFSIVFVKFESNLYCIEYFSMYSTSSLMLDTPVGGSYIAFEMRRTCSHIVIYIYMYIYS